MGLRKTIFGQQKVQNVIVPAKDAYFKTNELSGSSMVDATGNGNSGEYRNSVLYQQPGVTPQTKSVKYVKASNGYIRFPGSNPLYSIGTSDLTDTDWTMTFWLKRAQTEPDFFISKRGALPEWQARNFSVVGSEMYSRAQFSNRLSLNSGDLIMQHDGTWNFFAFVYDRTNEIVRRVQNTQFSEVVFPSAWTNIALTNADFHFGSDRGNGTFASETFVSEISIWKGSALSLEQTEIIRNEIL